MMTYQLDGKEVGPDDAATHRMINDHVQLALSKLSAIPYGLVTDEEQFILARIGESLSELGRYHRNLAEDIPEHGADRARIVCGHMLETARAALTRRKS